jgi:hypothetical protein
MNELSCKITKPIPFLLYPQKVAPFYERNACESVVTNNNPHQPPPYCFAKKQLMSLFTSKRLTTIFSLK